MSDAAEAMPRDEQKRCPGNGAEACGVPSDLLLEDGYCFAHSPNRKSERTAAATLGGIKAGAKRRRGLDPDVLGKLDTPADAKRMTSVIAIAVASGELPAPQARAALVAIQQWLRAYELDEVGVQIAKLTRLAHAKGKR